MSEIDLTEAEVEALLGYSRYKHDNGTLRVLLSIETSLLSKGLIAWKNPNRRYFGCYITPTGRALVENLEEARHG